METTRNTTCDRFLKHYEITTPTSDLETPKNNAEETWRYAVKRVSGIWTTFAERYAKNDAQISSEWQRALNDWTIDEVDEALEKIQEHQRNWQNKPAPTLVDFRANRPRKTFSETENLSPALKKYLRRLRNVEYHLTVIMGYDLTMAVYDFTRNCRGLLTWAEWGKFIAPPRCHYCKSAAVGYRYEGRAPMLCCWGHAPEVVKKACFDVNTSRKLYNEIWDDPARVAAPKWRSSNGDSLNSILGGILEQVKVS